MISRSLRLARGVAGLAVAFVLAAIVTSEVSAQGPPGAAKPWHPKLEHRFAQLVAIAPQGPDAVAAYAREHGLRLKAGLVVAVLVPHVGQGADSINLSAVRARGAILDAQSKDLVRVLVPPGLLGLVADEPTVRFVRPPLQPKELAISEGVAATGAAAFHSSGLTGVGVKVAVIDLGFQRLSDAVVAGEVPEPAIKIDYTGTGLEADTQHGTAVAEVVHDMAPGAQLFVYKIGDEVDLANAKDHAIANGARVANHSVGWVNASFYDGTGPISAVVNDARANGMLWVNAAGNEARRHWGGDLTDKDGDRWHEFSGSDEANQISGGSMVACVFLTWNDWPASAQDLDLYLVDRRGRIVAASEGWQTGTQEPTEGLCALVGGGPYSAAIRKYSVTKPLRLHLFSFYHDFEHRVAAGSLMDPAPAAGAVAVGAIDVANYTTGPIESFSSQGPTSDGRVKPDLAGPDGTSSWTYGGKFYGTSASSPHAAGASALLLEQDPLLTVNDLAARLETDAIDMGDPGKDTVYGAGRLNLVLAPDTNPPAAPSSLTATAEPGTVDLDWADNTEKDLTGYRVYRSTTAGTGYALLTGLLTTSAYSDTSGTPGQTYYYVVTASDASGNESGPSNEASAAPEEPSPGGGATLAVTGCNPSSGNRGSQLTVAVSGSGFQNGANANFGDQVMVQSVTFVSSGQLDVRIKIHPKANPGSRNVTITNPDGQSATGTACFTVN